MIGRATLAAALLAACLALVACGDDELAETTTGTEVSKPIGISAVAVADLADRAVELLGARAPEATWELFAEGSSLDEVIASVEDGSIVELTTGVASTTQLASTRMVELDAEAEAAFDAFVADIEAAVEADPATRHYASVVAQVILHGQGYTIQQITEAAKGGTLVLSEEDSLYCYWAVIDGFPVGAGFTIAGVTPTGANRFAGQECAERDGSLGDPGTGDGEDPPDGVVEETTEVGPPASGVQGSLDCESLQAPAGVTAEVNPESSAADPDDSGFARDVRCGFFLSDEGGGRGGIALNLAYYCGAEAAQRISELGDASDRSPVSGLADAYRELETSESPIISNAGEFYSQDKLFAKLGTYAVLTVVLNTDDDFASTDFVEMSRQLASQMHPPVAGALDYC